jgi:hypothetical protein
MANIVATKFIVFSLSSFSLRLITFLPEGVILGSGKFVCALNWVKLDEKWREKNLGYTLPPKKNKIEKSELSEMERTLIKKSGFFCPLQQRRQCIDDDDVDDNIDDNDVNDDDIDDDND